jgi:hypothetical protein
MAEEILKTEELTEETVVAEDIEETDEYDVFTIELDGVAKDWAILEEFEFTYEGVEKNYLICAEIIGDEMNDAGLYIFEGRADGDEVEVKNVESEEEYIAVAEAYCDFEE